MGPLTGITVVAVEQAVAAPFATRHLADLGARVIKIERPDGGDFARGYDATVNGLSSHFVWLNRSKQSLTLDLKRISGREMLTRLVERADVFVQNVAPGAAGRLGIRSDDLHECNPALIVCEISGYGSSGPYANRKAYDLLVQSEVGLLAITGSPEAPAKVGVSIADIAAGMYAYSGILTALLARGQTGKGTTIEVSLFDALAEWMGYAAYYTAYSGAAPVRTGAHHASIAPYGPFQTGDGEQVFLAVQNAREWTRFCADVLRQPDLACDDRFRTNALRVAHRSDLHDVAARVFGRLSAAALVERLDRAGIACARMNSVHEFLEHPQLAERNRWRDIGSPSGALRALVPPVTLPGFEAEMGDVPALGQHTDAILEELGVDPATIAAWRRDGAI